MPRCWASAANAIFSIVAASADTVLFCAISGITFSRLALLAVAWLRFVGQRCRHLWAQVVVDERCRIRPGVGASARDRQRVEEDQAAGLRQENFDVVVALVLDGPTAPPALLSPAQPKATPALQPPRSSIIVLVDTARVICGRTFASLVPAAL